MLNKNAQKINRPKNHNSIKLDHYTPLTGAAKYPRKLFDLKSEIAKTDFIKI